MKKNVNFHSDTSDVFIGKRMEMENMSKRQQFNSGVKQLETTKGSSMNGEEIPHTTAV